MHQFIITAHQDCHLLLGLLSAAFDTHFLATFALFVAADINHQNYYNL